MEVILRQAVENLGKPGDAIAAYVEVLGFNDTSLGALRALDDLYQRQSQWTELGDNLEKNIRRRASV